MNIKKRLLRTALLSLMALAVGAGIAFYQIKTQPTAVTINKTNHTGQGIPVQGISLGGPFTLTNQNGEIVTNETYAGQYKLIYFGFTYCPAICPTELQKMARVLRTIEPDIAAQIKPLFITIDPERDTVKVMRDYVELFHPDLQGLTGTAQQIQDIMKAYKIYARKVQEPDMNDYTMDHSSYLYLMSPDDKIVGLYRIQDKVPFLVEDIRAKISGQQ